MLNVYLKTLILLLALAAGSADCGDLNHDIIIVGAGVAGLSAAKALSEYYAGKGEQKKILILEGKGHVGGRVESVDFAGYTVERCASWINAGNSPPL